MDHQTVLLQETLDALVIFRGGVYVDATLGGGGHFLAILKALEKGVLVGFDHDQIAIDRFRVRIQQELGVSFDLVEPDVWRFHYNGVVGYLVWRNFKKLTATLESLEIAKINGGIFDLGVSSIHFDEGERGFSFMRPGLLDMRMDKRLAVTAHDLVNGLTKGELNVLFTQLGEERLARAIANACVRARRIKKINTTQELALLVEWVYLGSPGESFWTWMEKNMKTKNQNHFKKHPATRVFQALRIAVNDELNALKEGLLGMSTALAPGGRLAVVSFHSLEDRIVKDFIRSHTELIAVNQKVICASLQETKINRRSRSAKLRIAEKRA